MLLSDLLSEIIGVSERSAELARVIRSEHALFELLVEEKTGDSKNKRFIQDFKTLADVVVQEMVKHHLGTKFPGLAANIFGEESNQFTNALGETVEVSIQATQQDTCKLLERVLDGNEEAARLLASVVHGDYSPSSSSQLIPVQEVDETSLGIWIDPIDSTAQYIQGRASKPSASCEGVYEEGLQCVVVLIGVYNLASGAPILGVVNQPFCLHNTEKASWSGRCVWGLAYRDMMLHSCAPSPSHPPPVTTPSVIMSSSENPAILDALRPDFTLLDAAGAGYKILCVVDGLVDLYLLSKPSTFKWDTCSPQAILLAQKGGLLDYTKALGVVRSYREAKTEDIAEILQRECCVVYNKPDREGVEKGEEWANAGGIVAYRDIHVAVQMLKKLCSDSSLTGACSE